MDNNKFFIYINRINSILFLLAVIGALVSIVVLNMVTSSWDNKNSVQIIDGKGKESIELQLGSLEEMTGHDIQTVNLLSESPSRGFSSGYTGSTIRNVLFLSGENIKVKWLYENNNFLINCFCKLKESNKYNGEDPVLAVYVSVVTSDINLDGILSNKDGITLSLVRPNGSDYKEIEHGVSKVLDSVVSDNGVSVTFLLQIGTDIVVKKYSLSTFDLISERKISEISNNL